LERYRIIWNDLESRSRDSGPTFARSALEERAAGERRVRVLVVAHEEVVLVGFQHLLTMQPWVEGCLTAFDAAQARRLARRQAPHVALVESRLGTEPGVDVVESIIDVAPGVRVLVVDDEGSVSPATAVAIGAAGVVSKAWRASDLLMAIRMVGSGLSLAMPAVEKPRSLLSSREHEVLELIARGATNREIGERLHLSPHTVKQYASAVLRKLHARNRAEAVRRAQRLGLIA
jgi:DNA-binding NarL/FixJ family response regulator